MIFTSILFKNLLILCLLKYFYIVKLTVLLSFCGFFVFFFLGEGKKVEIRSTWWYKNIHLWSRVKNKKHIYKEKASLQAEDAVTPV